MPWFKVECGWWLTDWIIPLSSESQLCWLRLIEYTKEKGTRGTVKAISPAVAARVWMVGEESVRQLLIAAEASGAIVKEDSDWVITKWRDYQTDPTHAERQAGYRDRKKTSTASDSHVTARHSDKRHVTEVTPTGQERTGEENTVQDNQKSCAPEWLDVLDFASQIGKGEEDARRFFTYYEQKEWQTPSGPLANWKGMFRTWASSPLKVEHGGKSPGAITVEEAERIREGGPTPGSESPFAKLKRELAEKAAQGGDSA